MARRSLIRVDLGRKTYAFLALLMVCVFMRSAYGQVRSDIAIPPNGGNQRAEVSQWIGLVKITIAYHSPRVQGGGGPDRKGHIWGEFIPYGLFDEGRGPSKATPWRAGANENTTITFSHDVKVEGKDLKAGTYAIFLELQKSGPWIWIFSNHSTGWGSYQYDPKNDALQVSVNPQAAAYTEYLTYGFDDRRPDSALAYLQWENKRVPFKIEVPNVNELYVAEMRKDLEGWAGFSYENWQRAAQFCANNKINLEEALIWAEKAISEPFRGATQGVEDASTLGTKAAVLLAMGRDGEAEAIMERAIHIAGTPAFPVYQYGMRLLAAGKKEKALEVFKFNQQQHPEEKFLTSVGLARAYTAIGDRQNAITNWEIALQNVPDAQKTSIPAFENALKALKEGK
jgi:tetratricopeptide (TPR) repeat protein